MRRFDFIRWFYVVLYLNPQHGHWWGIDGGITKSWPTSKNELIGHYKIRGCDLLTEFQGGYFISRDDVSFTTDHTSFHYTLSFASLRCRDHPQTHYTHGNDASLRRGWVCYGLVTRSRGNCRSHLENLVFCGEAKRRHLRQTLCPVSNQVTVGATWEGAAFGEWARLRRRIPK